MVLQLSTSPFASKASGTSVSGPSSVSASSASPITRLSFWSDRALGSHRRSRLHQEHVGIHGGDTTINLDRTGQTHSGMNDTIPKAQTSGLLTGFWVRTAFRLAGVASGLSAIIIVPAIKVGGMNNGFGRGTQYLTIMSLLLTMVCLLLGVTSDVLKMPSLTRLKNAMLPVLVPVECAVGVLYWSLTLTNVFHIYPDGVRYIPLWLDIQMHGLPFMILMIEMFIYSEGFRVRRVPDFCAVALFALFYISWSSFCAHVDGYWPYPILENITNPWERLRLMLNSSAIGLVLHLIISETHIRTMGAKSKFGSANASM